MEGKEHLLLIGLTAVLLAVLGFGIYSITAGSWHTEAKFQAAIAAQNPEDKCATPEGYSDEQWRQHWGHHPDIYKECLDKYGIKY